MDYKIKDKYITEFLEDADCFFHPGAQFEVCLTETKLLNLPEPLKIVQCSECKLKYLNPRINPYGYDLLYKEDYYTKGSGSAGVAYKDYAFEKIAYFTGKLKFIESIYPLKGSLFDIGASMGHFLKIAKDLGWTIDGIDLSKWASDYAKENFNIDIFVGSLEDYIKENQEFDVITSFHLLEHLSNPLETIKIMNSILKPGGILMIEVPNQFNDLFTKLSLPYQKYKAKQSNPTIVHTYFFNVKILTYMIRQNGFEIIKINTWRKGYPIYGKNLFTKFIKKVINNIGNIFNMGDIIEITARKIK